MYSFNARRKNEVAKVRLLGKMKRNLDKIIEEELK